jgi:hypothetical protein
MHAFGEHGDNIACVNGRLKSLATITNYCSIVHERRVVEAIMASYQLASDRQVLRTAAMQNDATIITRLQFS